MSSSQYDPDNKQQQRSNQLSHCALMVAGFGRLGRDGRSESQHGGEVHGKQSFQGHLTLKKHLKHLNI